MINVEKEVKDFIFARQNLNFFRELDNCRLDLMKIKSLNQDPMKAFKLYLRQRDMNPFIYRI